MNLNVRLTARRKKAFLVGLGVLALTACQDAVAPSRPSLSGRPSLASSPTATASFTYDPGTGVTAEVGAFKIKMPYATVCDPTTSSYGTGTWDAPCAAAQTPITITATAYTNAAGRRFIQFEPALRFTTNPSGKDVVLYVYDKSVAIDPSTRILYCPDGGACIDEAATDPSVAVNFDAPNGFVFRRLKHFSGYNVTAGFSGSDSTGTTTSYTTSYTY